MVAFESKRYDFETHEDRHNATKKNSYYGADPGQFLKELVEASYWGSIVLILVEPIMQSRKLRDLEI